jgi:large conductance mechanosensitive channel
MLSEFKSFLVKQNVLALALAVVVGAATGALVNSIVEGLFMPLIGAVFEGAGTWEEFVFPSGENVRVQFRVGLMGAALVNFTIVAFVAFLFTKMILRPPPPGAPPVTVSCPFCRSRIDPAATRCPHCTSEVKPA